MGLGPRGHPTFVEGRGPILTFSHFLHNKNILLTSSSLSFFVRLFCKQVEFVGVLRLRTSSEERDPFYPGRRLSTILGTN